MRLPKDTSTEEALSTDSGPDFCARILSQCNFPLLITDPRAPDNPIVYANRAFERLTGYSLQEVIGRNCRFLQAEDRKQPAIGAIADALGQGKPAEEIIRNYRRNGEMFWNRLYIFPLKDEQGSVTNYVGIQHDITREYLAILYLKEQQRLLEDFPDPYLKLDSKGNILEANRAVERVFGWTPDELIGTSAYRLVPPDRQREARSNVTARMSQNMPARLTGEYLHRNGSRVLIEWVLSPGAAHSTLLCIGRDMTERHRAEEETRQAKERISVILASITEGCFSIDHQWRFTYINAQGARWLMHAPEDLLGKPLLEVFPEAVGSVFHETYQRTMEQQAFAECEAFYAPLGAWFNARAYPSPEGVTVFFLDISERKRNEQRLLHAATHDALTGLTNRASCIGTLEELLQEARAAGRKLGVLFIDLDRFKEINDAFSHRVGDKALACIGRRLCEQADAARLPARISGDAFLFILPDTDERSATAFAFSVIETIGKPMRIEQAEISVGASIGIAISDNEPLSPDELINRADSAMYRAKAAGRHTAVMYSPGIALWEKRRHQLRRELSAALRAGQFELFYQPQYLLADGQVTGAEALIRWRHPQYGLLAPDAFLQLAEESALILEVGAWVIDEACRQAAQWKREGHALKMSVNVSTRQLNDSNLPALLTQYSAKHGLDPSAIKIEITESMLAQDFDTAAEVLSALKEKGFRIALDDFGTGYSNLAYINRFPINAIKIDRSFVRNLATDSAALRLVNGIVALAKSLDLTVIVEGVETEEQRTALRTTPCDTIQGYLTGRPVPAQEFYTQHLRRQG